jgi:hypothetical protein
VAVEKFSTGSAKKARYASEWPSSSRRRSREETGVAGTVAILGGRYDAKAGAGPPAVARR